MAQPRPRPTGAAIGLPAQARRTGYWLQGQPNSVVVRIAAELVVDIRAPTVRESSASAPAKRSAAGNQCKPSASADSSAVSTVPVPDREEMRAASGWPPEGGANLQVVSNTSATAASQRPASAFSLPGADQSCPGGAGHNSSGDGSGTYRTENTFGHASEPSFSGAAPSQIARKHGTDK